ncbi:hypothetical protein K504DRAFT_457066 [Pleomassaria siparia CBS 279.74]|uniref:Transcription initiation factor TFIID subunit 4 n=1 Tax=Pleomassaria siparia CBS 279.74 TaxID=1314801 RepID=A0A6G1KRC3_9PLEO|nr:hypothetical protein K504DRAFT_457066 [Pleomassaria siparia CBS 279.74]
MAHPQYNAYQQQMNNLPPVNTNQHQQHQNVQSHPQHQQQQQQHPNHGSGAFSPQPYLQSPSSALSPTGGYPANKRQRLSPNPPSPYQSPFSASPYTNQNQNVTSPYASSPPGNSYVSLPPSPAAMQPQHSFHQPQAYQHHNPNDMNARPPPQGSMPPPKVPYSKSQDNPEQLEKANPRDMDVNNISDVLTGSGIDLRAEEDNLLHNFGSRPAYGASFNSQASASTVSPHGSFNQWGQVQSAGAFQGTGPLSQSYSQEQQEAELMRKHDQASRAFAESAQAPLTDPFLFANVLRHRIAKRAYEHNVKVHLEGLFDKIPEYPQNVTRTTLTASNGESISGITADSLLNQNASFVEVISLISLATQERVRSVLEDALAMKEIRQKSSHGTVPHDMADLAISSSKSKSVTVAPLNVSKTAWEVPNSAISPTTQTTSKKPVSAARLPTPPTDAPPTPQPTIEFVDNQVTRVLKRRAMDDYNFEKARVEKRLKRKQSASATPTDMPVISLPLPEKQSKKQRDRDAKAGNTEAVQHAKTNDTVRFALGKKPKFAWMVGGASSGASTPRQVPAAGGSASGSSTPARPQQDEMLNGRKRVFGEKIENSDIGDRLQLRDLVHVLENDGRERKTLTKVLARIKSTEKDERTSDDRRQTMVLPAR